MLSLASKYGHGQVLLKNVAKEQEISQKYLSIIIIPLKGKGLVRSTRGSHGGYELARPPGEISMREIVEALDEEACLVDCLRDPGRCTRSPLCASRELWVTLGQRISETLGSITLANLAEIGREKAEKFSINYVV